MTTPPKVGLYRLTRAVANPAPDRRKRYDFWARPEWPAGTLVQVYEYPLIEDRTLLVVRAVARAHAFGSEAADSDRARSVLAACEPYVPASLADVLLVAKESAACVGPYDVLARLIAAGRLTLADVQATCDALVREVDDPDPPPTEVPT